MIISPKSISELRLKYNSLSPKVKRVADYIIRYPEKVLTSSIQELAQQIGVSQYTVLNCVRAVGYRGYSDFRLSLAMNVQQVGANQDASPHAQINSLEADPSYLCFTDTFESNARCLLDTMHIIKTEAFINTINNIFMAKRTAIYGIGFSSYAAQYLCMQLVRLGLHAVPVTDASYQVLDALTLIENDLLIGFSASGTAPSILEAFRLSKQNKCHTVAVTAVEDSPLAREADTLLLVTRSGPRHSADTDNSIVEQISLASAIATSVYQGLRSGRRRTI